MWETLRPSLSITEPEINDKLLEGHNIIATDMNTIPDRPRSDGDRAGTALSVDNQHTLGISRNVGSYSSAWVMWASLGHFGL